MSVPRLDRMGSMSSTGRSTSNAGVSPRSRLNVNTGASAPVLPPIEAKAPPAPAVPVPAATIASTAQDTRIVSKAGDILLNMFADLYIPPPAPEPVAEEVPRRDPGSPRRKSFGSKSPRGSQNPVKSVSTVSLAKDSPASTKRAAGRRPSVSGSVVSGKSRKSGKSGGKSDDNVDTPRSAVDDEDRSSPPPPPADPYDERIKALQAKRTDGLATKQSVHGSLEFSHKVAADAEQASVAEARARFPSVQSASVAPRGRSKLELDPLVLQDNSLVDVRRTQVHSESIDLLAATASSEPGYLKGTKIHKVHIIPPAEGAATTSQKRSRDPTTIGNAQRSMERTVFRRMTERVHFLQNPRHIAPGQDKFGRKTVAAEDMAHPFRATPAAVEFVGYTAGGTYEATLTLRNHTMASHRLRILPPATRFFGTTAVTYAGDTGIVAPGMVCTLRVLFNPEGNGDYDDAISIEADGGGLSAPLVVPVRARRPPPRLSLPEHVNVGAALVGGRTRSELSVVNTGGRATFHILRLRDWEARRRSHARANQSAADTKLFGSGLAATMRSTGTRPTRVSSSRSHLPPPDDGTDSDEPEPSVKPRAEGKAAMMLSFSQSTTMHPPRRDSPDSEKENRQSAAASESRPESASPASGEAHALYETDSLDGGDDDEAVPPESIDEMGLSLEPAVFTLEKGERIMLRFGFSARALGEVSLPLKLVCDHGDEVDVVLHGTGVRSQIEMLPTTSTADADLPRAVRRVAANTAIPQCMLQHGTVPINAQAVEPVRIANRTPVALTYEWRVFDAPLVRGNMSHLPGMPPAPPTEPLKLHAPNGVGAPVWCSPASGVMPASSEVSFDVVFRPLAIQTYDLRAVLVLKGAGEEIGGVLRDVEAAEITILGTGAASTLRVEPAMALFGAALVTVPASRTLVLHNPQPAPVHFSIMCSSRSGDSFDVVVVPEQGTVPPQSSLPLRVDFVGHLPGAHRHDFAIAVAHGPEIPVTMHATVKGPSVTLSPPTVDLGLVQLGQTAQCTVTLVNDSELPAPFVMCLEGAEDVPSFLTVNTPPETRFHAIHVAPAPDDHSPAQTGPVMFEPQRGVVGPREQAVVTVRATLAQIGRARHLLQCLVARGEPSVMSIEADVQSPAVVVAPSHLELGRAFLGVPVNFRLTVTNATLLETAFQWNPRSDADCVVTFAPTSARLPPRGSVEVAVTFVGRRTGQRALVLDGDVTGMAEPIGVSINAFVAGTAVTLEVPGKGAQNSILSALIGHEAPEQPSVPASTAARNTGGLRGALLDEATLALLDDSPANTSRVPPVAISAGVSTAVAPATVTPPTLFSRAPSVGMSRFPSFITRSRAGDGSLVLDLGSECPVFESRSMTFVLRNVTAIPTSFRLGVVNEAPTAPAEAPKQRPASGATASSNKTRSRGGRSQTKEKEAAPTKPILAPDYEQKHALVSASGQQLLSTRREKEHAYSTISGMLKAPGVVFAVSPKQGQLPPFGETTITLTGYNNTRGQFTDSLMVAVDGTEPVTFPIAYGIVGEIIELVPNTLGLSLIGKTPQLTFGSCVCAAPPVTRYVRVQNRSPFDMRVALTLYDCKPQAKLIDLGLDVDRSGRVSLQIAEHLEPSVNGAFSLEPADVIIPGNGQATLAVRFEPRAAGLHEAFMLARSRPASDKTGSKISRSEPLRLNLVARATEPFLHSDTQVVKFFCYKGVAAGHASLRGRLVLVNIRESAVAFQVSATGPFVVYAGKDKSQECALQSGQNQELTVDFTPPSGLIPDDNFNAIIDGAVTITFSNGQTQSFPIQAVVSFPNVSLSANTLAFHDCFISSQHVTTLTLTNTSAADATWRIAHTPTSDSILVRVTDDRTHASRNARSARSATTGRSSARSSSAALSGRESVVSARSERSAAPTEEDENKSVAEQSVAPSGVSSEVEGGAETADGAERTPSLNDAASVNASLPRDDPSCVSFESMSGVVPARAVGMASPSTVTIKVVFRPKRLGAYLSTYSVVLDGKALRFTVTGSGTLEENKDKDIEMARFE